MGKLNFLLGNLVIEGEAEEVWELWVEIKARETSHMAEIARGEWEQRGREGKVLSFRD